MWRTRLRVEEAGHDSSHRAVWELLEPLVFESRALSAAGATTIVVPPVFRTNYASVPRLPLVFLMAGDRAHKEAALHDWLYTVHTYERELADAVFLEALLLNPLIPPGLAHTMHKAVRWFGASSWESTTTILQDPAIAAMVQPLVGDLL